MVELHITTVLRIDTEYIIDDAIDNNNAFTYTFPFILA